MNWNSIELNIIKKIIFNEKLSNKDQLIMKHNKILSNKIKYFINFFEVNKININDFILSIDEINKQKKSLNKVYDLTLNNFIKDNKELNNNHNNIIIKEINNVINIKQTIDNIKLLLNNNFMFLGESKTHALNLDNIKNKCFNFKDNLIYLFNKFKNINNINNFLKNIIINQLDTVLNSIIYDVKKINKKNYHYPRRTFRISIIQEFEKIMQLIQTTNVNLTEAFNITLTYENKLVSINLNNDEINKIILNIVNIKNYSINKLIKIIDKSTIINEILQKNNMIISSILNLNNDTLFTNKFILYQDKINENSKEINIILHKSQKLKKKLLDINTIIDKIKI